jgi:adenylate kinase family enzyme
VGKRCRVPDDELVTRVLVIGNGATGKTTFSERLAARIGLEVHHLDGMAWRAGWQRVPEDEFEAALAKVLAGPRWIVDGVAYPQHIPERIERADTVIFIDYSLPRIYWWALKKEARYAFRQRPEMPADTPEWKITWRLLKIIWKIHFGMRAEWIALVTQAAKSGKTVHHFRRPRETQRFLEGLA